MDIHGEETRTQINDLLKFAKYASDILKQVPDDPEDAELRTTILFDVQSVIESIHANSSASSVFRQIVREYQDIPEGTIQQITRENQELRQSVQESQNQVQLKDEKIREISNQNSQLRRLKDESDRKVQLKDEEIREISYENSQLRKQKEEIDSKVQQLENRIKEISYQNSQLHIKQEETSGNQEDYDFQFKIENISDLKQGWKFLAPAATEDKQNTFMKDQPFEQCNVVAVVGHFSKGKTYVLNEIYKTKFASGLVEHTQGLSFKWVDNIILCDTVGTCSPVNLMNREEVVSKKATEMFLQDVIFMIANYILIVINDLTWPDQEYIEALAYRLSLNYTAEKRQTKSVFIIHNYKEATTQEDVDSLFKEQVLDPYSRPNLQTDDSSTFMPPAIQKSGAQVSWYRSRMHGIDFRHFIIGRSNTPGGANNQSVFEVLANQLTSLQFSDKVYLKKKLLEACETCISNYLKGYGELQWQEQFEENSNENLLYTMVPTQTDVQTRHRLSYQPSGLGINLTYSTFTPTVDKVTLSDSVHYFIDVPSLTEVELQLNWDPEDNFYELIIQGDRKEPEAYKDAVVQRERKLGIFERKLAVKAALLLQNPLQQIPSVDGRRMYTGRAKVENGVLHLHFNYSQPSHFPTSTFHKVPSHSTPLIPTSPSHPVPSHSTPPIPTSPSRPVPYNSTPTNPPAQNEVDDFLIPKFK